MTPVAGVESAAAAAEPSKPNLPLLSLSEGQLTSLKVEEPVEVDLNAVTEDSICLPGFEYHEGVCYTEQAWEDILDQRSSFAADRLWRSRDAKTATRWADELLEQQEQQVDHSAATLDKIIKALKKEEKARKARESSSRRRN